MKSSKADNLLFFPQMQLSFATNCIGEKFTLHIIAQLNMLLFHHVIYNEEKTQALRRTVIILEKKYSLGTHPLKQDTYKCMHA